MNRKHIGIAATAALALFGASAAFASPNTVETRVAVNYADLDLASPKGVERLYSRLQTAAEKACGRADVRDLKGRERVRDCTEGALERAVNEIGHEALSALHFGSSPVRYAQLERAARGS